MVLQPAAQIIYDCFHIKSFEEECNLAKKVSVIFVVVIEKKRKYI